MDVENDISSDSTSKPDVIKDPMSILQKHMDKNPSTILVISKGEYGMEFDLSVPYSFTDLAFFKLMIEQQISKMYQSAYFGPKDENKNTSH